jgi:hypothetical protein
VQTVGRYRGSFVRHTAESFDVMGLANSGRQTRARRRRTTNHRSSRFGDGAA